MIEIGTGLNIEDLPLRYALVTLEPNSIDGDLFRTLPVEVLKRYGLLSMIEPDR